MQFFCKLFFVTFIFYWIYFEIKFCFYVFSLLLFSIPLQFLNPIERLLSMCHIFFAWWHSTLLLPRPLLCPFKCEELILKTPWQLFLHFSRAALCRIYPLAEGSRLSARQIVASTDSLFFFLESLQEEKSGFFSSSPFRKSKESVAVCVSWFFLL